MKGPSSRLVRGSVPPGDRSMRARLRRWRLPRATPFQPGNGVDVLVDGEAFFPRIRVEIEAARHDLEVSAMILSPRVGGRMDEIFETDRARCQSIELARWKKRPLTQRLLEWFFGLFRRYF